MGSTFSYEGPEGASTAFGPKMYDRYPGLVPQGISAEMMAEKWNLDRNELEWRQSTYFDSLSTT